MFLTKYVQSHLQQICFKTPTNLSFFIIAQLPDNFLVLHKKTNNLLFFTIAQLPDNFLVFTDTKNHSIYRMDLTTKSYVQIPITRADNPISIDYDPIGGNIYWTDVGLKEIRTASINGENERTIRMLGNGKFFVSPT